MIETEGIVKRFGRVVAVDRVSFAVPAGAICGFLGPNGAGKSTTIRMVVGAMAPDAGTVTVAGMRMDADAPEARRAVGYLPEESPVQPDLTVDEFVRFRAELYGVPRRGRDAAVDRALGACSVLDVRRRLCGQLSKGYRQRVGLAAAIVHGPSVLVLDEPTSGLDPEQVLEFRALLRSLSSTTTILLSSHVLAEVEASCDRAVLIDRGRVLASGSMHELRGLGTRAHRVVVELRRDPAPALRSLAFVAASLPGPASGEWLEHALELRDGTDPSTAATEIGNALHAAGNPPRSLRIESPTLEGIFLRIVRDRREKRS
jgi:ABC-2 type transport system ATP-binding protein